MFSIGHLLLLITLLSQLAPVNAQSKKESSTIQIYNNAKKEFLSFERSHGAFVQTRNVNMHYLSWGNPGNPCIIWAHGSLNNGYELLDIADSLVKAGYHVIAIDYYGHGQTAMPDHEVSIYHIADDIKFLMDKLSIERAFVGGFSRGGYVATAFYNSYPENVLGLILEDGGSVAANTYYHKLDTNKLEQISKKFDLKQATPWDKTYPTQLEAFNSLYDSTEVSNQFPIFALLKENKSGDWGIIYSDMMKLFNLENSGQFTDLVLRTSKVPLFARSMVTMEPETIFRNLRIPVLILDPVSQDDPMPFEKENEALKNVHPDYITYKVYPNTEHNIHYAHPARFTKDVIEFLDRSYDYH